MALKFKFVINLIKIAQKQIKQAFEQLNACGDIRIIAA